MIFRIFLGTAIQYIKHCIKTAFNPFHAAALFLHLQETSEKFSFSNV